LGIRDIGGDVTVERKAPSDEVVWNVGFVLAGAAILLRLPGEVADPATLQNL
jgi:hypothetical protein